MPRSASRARPPSGHTRTAAAPFGPATAAVRAFLVVATGLTPEQADDIAAAQRGARTMAWLAATNTAWKVARKSGLQGTAEKAHGAAYAAATGNADVKEAAAFAVLPLVLGRRLDPGVTALLRGPWEAGAPAPAAPEVTPETPTD